MTNLNYLTYSTFTQSDILFLSAMKKFSAINSFVRMDFKDFERDTYSICYLFTASKTVSNDSHVLDFFVKRMFFQTRNNLSVGRSDKTIYAAVHV